MKKIMIAAMASLLMLSTACSAGESVQEETEPEKQEEKQELVEVEITKENWQDYFELYEEPYTIASVNEEELPRETTDFSTVIDNKYIDQEHQNTDIPMGFQCMVKIKDEYIGQLDFNHDNSLVISYTTELRSHVYEGDEKVKKIGAEVTADEGLLMLYGDEQRAEQEKYFMEMRGEIDDAGYFCKRENQEKIILDKDLTKGTVLYQDGFTYRMVLTDYEDPDDMTSYWVLQISEGPCMITAADSVDWTDISGTIYLNQ